MFKKTNFVVFVGISIFLCAAVYILTPAVSQAASLYFSPSSGTYTVGHNFTVSVVMDSAQQAMNAADGIVNFPNDKLAVVGISKTPSIFNLWVQEPSFSNSGNGGGTGNVRYEGVVLNPGYTGYGAKLLNITFRVRSAGVARVTFASGSVLANDGEGTNILDSLGSATFNLQAGAGPLEPPLGVLPKPIIQHYIKIDNEWVLKQSSDSPSQWINSRDSRFVWKLPGSAGGVSTALDTSPSTVPLARSEGLFDSKTVEGLVEGIHYFHIRFINSQGGGPTLHYKMMVDVTPPRPFKIGFPDASVTINPRPRITFSTVDDLSGISHYEIKVDNSEFFNADTITDVNGFYRLPKQALGTHNIIVRAFDKAGNYYDAQAKLIVEPIASPKILYYPEHLTSPGESLVIGGTASPDATVEIHAVKRGETVFSFIAKANSEGRWEGIYAAIIPSGRYEVWAKQILENGAESLPSPSIYIRVNSLFWKLWQWLKNIGLFVILLWLLLLILLFLTYYFWHRFRMLRLRMQREAREVQEALDRDIEAIGKEVVAGEEPEKIAEDLKRAHEDIEKEIKDIENL